MDLLSGGPSIIIYHILPTYIAALFYYAIANFFIFVFRVKKASVKYFIHLTVLYKVFLSLINGANFSNLTITKPFNFGINFYDPLGLFPFGFIGPLPDVNFEALQSPFVSNLISIVLLIVVVLLLFRWTATSWFIRKAIKEGEQEKKDLNIIKCNLAARLKIRPPKIIISNEDLGPLVAGVLRPIVIIPKKIINGLSQDELSVVIGHELAHIKRKDNLFQWITLFLKDILFFNPFVRSTYKKIILYKEISADNILINTSLNINKNSLLRTIRKVNEIMHNNHSLDKGKNILIAKASFLETDALKMRLRALENMQKISWLQNTSSYACLLFFLWFKVWLALNLTDKTLMLLP